MAALHDRAVGDDHVGICVGRSHLGEAWLLPTTIAQLLKPEACGGKLRRRSGKTLPER